MTSSDVRREGPRIPIPPSLFDGMLVDCLPDQDDRNLLVRWCEVAREHGRPVVFLGAGMPLNARPAPGNPTDAARRPRALNWAQLSARLQRDLPAAERGLADPLWLAELYERTYNRHDLMAVLAEAVPVDRLDPGPTYEALARLDWHAVLTTNYDDLAERAMNQWGRRTIRVWRDEQLATAQRVAGVTPVLHLHGVLEDPTSIILTLEDYRRYDTTRPGLLTKVRQLLMEHPTLFVGFGATDPNFIRWMGWVADAIGPHAPLHLNLDVTPDGTSASAPRRRYWDSRLHIVPCRVEKLHPLIAKIGQFQAGLTVRTDGSVSPEVEALLGLNDPNLNAESVLEALWSVWPLMDVGASPNGAYASRQHLLQQVVGVLLTTRFGETEAQKMRRVMSMVSRDDPYWAIFPNHPRPEEAVHHERKLAWIREAVGPIWPGFVVDLARRVNSPTVDLLGVHVSFEDEAALLPDIDAKPLRRLLAWRALLRRLDDGQDASPDFDSHYTLTNDERSEIRDRVHRRRWLAGESVDADVATVTPQDHRRLGHLAAVMGRTADAWEHYAAAASLDSAEPPDVQWATLESALIAARNAQFADRTTKMKATDARSAVFQERRYQLVGRSGYAASWFMEQATTAITRALTASLTQGGRPRSTQRTGLAAGDPSSGTRPTLDWAEGLWLHPALTGPIADAWAICAWHQREIYAGDDLGAEAVRLWRRYGSGHLVTIAHEYVAAGSPDEVIGSWLGDALLAPIRSASDALATVRAVRAYLPQLTQEQWRRVPAWLKDAEPDGSTSYIYGGGMLTPKSTLRQEILKLRVDYSGYQPPEEALDTLLQVARTNGHGWDWVHQEAVLDEVSRRSWSDTIEAQHLEVDVAIERMSALFDAIPQQSHQITGVERLIQVMVDLHGASHSPAVARVVSTWTGAAAVCSHTHARVLSSRADESARTEAATWAEQLLTAGIANAEELKILAILAPILPDELRVRTLATLLDTAMPEQPAGEWDFQVAHRRSLIAATLAEMSRTLGANALDEASDQVDEARLRWRASWSEDPSVVEFGVFSSAPSAWIGQEVVAMVEAILLGRHQRAGGALDHHRIHVLGAVAPICHRGTPEAWALLDPMARLLRHADPRVVVAVVANVGRLALHTDPDAPHADWRRWADTLLAASEDRRALPAAAVARAVTRAASATHPDAATAVAQVRDRVARDERASVIARLSGW
jgi:hypothetical protein